jgi:hypothetical protein
VARRKPEPKPEHKEERVEEYKPAPEVKPEDVIIDYQVASRRNLKEVIGKNIVIYSVDFRSGRRGTFAVIDAIVEETGEEAQFYTFSKPVIEELERLSSIFEEGKRLRVRICVNERKGYLYLCEPVKRSG